MFFGFVVFGQTGIRAVPIFTAIHRREAAREVVPPSSGRKIVASPARVARWEPLVNWRVGGGLRVPKALIYRHLSFELPCSRMSRWAG